jgi:hypothetical protein
MALPTPKKVTGLFDYFKKLNEKRLDKKFDIAEDEARKQGVDVLGLDIDNTATDRALAMKKYGLDYSQTLKNPLYHGTTNKFDKFNKKKSNHFPPIIFTSKNKSEAEWYSRKILEHRYPYSHIKTLISPKTKHKPLFRRGNNDPSFASKRIIDEPEYLRYKPYVKGKGKKQVSHFNPKLLGIGGAGATVSGLLSAEEMPSSEQELKAPDRNDLTRNIGGLLPFMADSYKYVANEGGLLGEILYGGGAKALDNLSYGDTPMKPKGHLPFRTPTNESILNLMELLQL